MNKTEWQTLAEALKKCRNSGGTLHYNYDNALANLIDSYSPENGYPYIKQRGYKIEGKPHETIGAIDNWVNCQMDMEDTCIITNAQLLFGDSDVGAREKAVAQMEKENRLLKRAVHQLRYNVPFCNCGDRVEKADWLFAVASTAIDEFQKTPTALILFPNDQIDDIKVFGGFYGAPWSCRNNRALNLKFRTINPHFEISVCTVWENDNGSPGWGNRRKVGILFTYTNLW